MFKLDVSMTCSARSDGWRHMTLVLLPTCFMVLIG